MKSSTSYYQNSLHMPVSFGPAKGRHAFLATELSLNIILIFVTLTLASISFVYAGDNMLTVQSNKSVIIITDSEATFVLTPVFISGKKVIGANVFVCSKVTDCTIDTPGIYSLTITPTTVKTKAPTIDFLIRNKN